MSSGIAIRTIAPGDIEAESFRIIDSEVPEPRLYSGYEWEIVRRMIHTTADFDMLNIVRFGNDAVAAGLDALRNGATIVTDTEMARRGIPMRRMTPLSCTVQCLMNDERVAELARSNGTTRAFAAVDVAVRDIVPSIYVIGNAPTALVRLVEHMREGHAAPKLVVGMPVGFVNAEESKGLLQQEGVPYITIAGRKGGSPLAACVINALADILLRT